MGYMGVSQTPTYPIVLWLGGLMVRTLNFGFSNRGSNPRRANLIGELAEWLIAAFLKSAVGAYTTNQEFESPTPRTVS